MLVLLVTINVLWAIFIVASSSPLRLWKLAKKKAFEQVTHTGYANLLIEMGTLGFLMINVGAQELPKWLAGAMVIRFLGALAIAVYLWAAHIRVGATNEQVETQVHEGLHKAREQETPSRRAIAYGTLSYVTGRIFPAVLLLAAAVVAWPF